MCARARLADANKLAMAGAGVVRPLIARLASPSPDVQTMASGALSNLAWGNGMCRSVRSLRACRFHPPGVLSAAANTVTIIAAGAVPPLGALLSSRSLDVQRRAAGALSKLALNGTLGGTTVRACWGSQTRCFLSRSWAAVQERV